MKLRKHYTFEQLLAMNKEYEAIDLQKLLDEMSYIGILEYDYGDITTTITSLKTVRESDVTAYPFTYPVRPSFSTLPLTE